VPNPSPRAPSTALSLAICLAAAFSAGCERPPAQPVARPNFLVLSLDTTRADRLGIYGYDRPTSPHLDRLARDGAWYERAHTTATWTLPSHASLFTGKFPTSHGARYDAEGPLVLGEEIEGPDAFKQIRARGLGAGESTLAERLRDAGWRTGGVVAGPWMKAVFGLARGFDDWDDRDISSVNGRPARAVTDAAIAWLDADRERPFLLFLNYFDAHSPFYPPRRFVEEVVPEAERPKGEAKTLTEISGLYDAEIRAMDFHIGRLLDHLRATGRYDSTWIVAVADHGELLGEQNEIGHGASLFEPELRIPFLVKPLPGEEPRGARSEPVQISDVFPMLLSRAGLPVPQSTQSAFPPPPDRPVFAEVNPLPKFGGRGDWRAVVHGDWKYLESGKGDRLLFDLAKDPGETTNVADRHPEVKERLRALLGTWMASLPPPAPAPIATDRATEVDAATREALESLGYLDGGDTPGPAPGASSPAPTP
jgi:arylsulfatase A-like enzyme